MRAPRFQASLVHGSVVIKPVVEAVDLPDRQIVYAVDPRSQLRQVFQNGLSFFIPRGVLPPVVEENYQFLADWWPRARKSTTDDRDGL